MSTTQTTQQLLERGIRQVHAEGQGVWRLSIITEASSPALIRAAMAGDAYANTVLRAAIELIQQIHARRARASGLSCMLCSNLLWRDEPPAAMGIMTAYGDGASTVIGQGFCSDCADGADAQLGQAVVTMLRGWLMPDLRIIPAPSALGHA